MSLAVSGVVSSSPSSMTFRAQRYCTRHHQQRRRSEMLDAGAEQWRSHLQRQGGGYRFIVSYDPVSVCLSVCPSVIIRYIILYRNGLNSFLAYRGYLWLILYIVLKWNSCISKNMGTSLWNFVPNSRLKKFSQLHVDQLR